MVEKMDRRAIMTFIISIALGAILYIRLLSLGEPSSRGDGAIIEGFLRVMFGSIAAGVVAGFFAGKNIVWRMRIGAAYLAAIIGWIAYTNIYLGYSLWYFLRPEIIPILLILTIPAIIGGAAGGWIRKHRPY